MLKVLIVAVFVVVALASSYTFLSKNIRSNSIAYPPPSEVSTMISQSLSTTYFGVLPCADCSGLETTITLSKSSAEATKGTYKQILNYQGKSVEPLESSGNWKLEKGIKDYPNADVIALDPDKPEVTEYYLQSDPDTLTTLDKTKNKIDAPFNLSLKKQ